MKLPLTAFTFASVGLVVGIVVGWSARSYLLVESQETASLSSITKEGFSFLNQFEDSPKERMLGGATEAPQKSGVNSSTGSAEQKVLDLIEQQNVEGMLEVLRHSGLNLVQNKTLYHTFIGNLYQLYQQNNGRTLGVWIDRMLDEGYNYNILHFMDAKLALLKGDRLAALMSFFLARHYSITAEEIDETQLNIENLVVDMMNLYRENSTNVSRQTALSVMQFAMEKQPENPLFGVEISILYGDGGDLDSAIQTLNLIPYSEKYQDTIVSLKTKWLNAKNTSEKVTSAISLKQVGQHFHVTAIVNQQTTLNLMIDTGATTTALSREAINFLRSTYILNSKEGTVSITTANGNANVDYYRVGLFAIGEYAVEDFELLEIEISESGSFDGLLGMNFLSLFEFEIDQTNRQLFLTARRER